MWICSKLGFFSVVRKAPDEFHVRARCAQDLVNLTKAARESGAFPEVWKREGWPKIHRSEPADYRFRMVVSGAQWTALGRELVGSVDYANFKGVIARTPGQAGKLRIYSKFHHDLEAWQHDGEASRDCGNRPD